ncbi:Hypothetical predicted protein [Paramuricea clavata]|uniref:Uncharacterized protein n=1 Tax=Paramuricea clavata TaxID=317549 RepID=A0A6S7I9R4_PARCT|nr:Hypothetical predicted protein [Paramuricea clavata]
MGHCSAHIHALIRVIDYPKRKVLATGSVPTQNLPTKSHKVETKKHCVLVRSSTDDEPSTSTSLKKGSLSLEKFWKHMQKDEVLGSWKVEHETNECEFRLELLDGCHIIPKPENIGELLRSIESVQLCEGLPDLTEVKDIALDPADDARIPRTLIRHSLPKLVTNNEAVFEVSVSFRSVACSLLQENNTNCDKPCKLCSGALNAIKTSSRKKSKSAAIPAKSKAPLLACGKEKLRVTLEATRLENKQLHDVVQKLAR